MNSMSKYYYKDDCDHRHKEKKSDKHCPAIVKCGPVGGTTPVPDGITAAAPLVLTRLVVNIPKCCDPCIIIEYASTVTFLLADEGTGGTATFTVSIFKNCLNNIRIPLASYTFSRTSDTDQTTASTESFSFFVCDCNNCLSECCYYSAEITASTLVGDGTRVAVNVPTLSAISGDSDC